MQVPCDWLTSLNVKLVVAIYLTQFLDDIFSSFFFASLQVVHCEHWST